MAKYELIHQGKTKSCWPWPQFPVPACHRGNPPNFCRALYVLVISSHLDSLKNIPSRSVMLLLFIFQSTLLKPRELDARHGSSSPRTPDPSSVPSSRPQHPAIGPSAGPRPCQAAAGSPALMNLSGKILWSTALNDQMYCCLLLFHALPL